MVSQTQLVAELRDRGYHVTERQLRDWRAKGLLPPLSRRSQGRGLGVLRYWEDSGIILSRAIAVCDLLDRNGRTKSVPLRLWFAGFEVNVATVRALWLESLACTRKEWIGTALSKEECEDAIGVLCPRLAKGLSDQSWARNAQLPWTRLEPLLFEALNAFFNPHPDTEIAIDEQLADSARALMCHNLANRERTEFISEPELEKWLDFIRCNFSISAMHEIIALATDDELKMTHTRWRTAVELFKLLGANASGGALSDDLRQFGRRAAFQFGGLCIFGLLLLSRNGKGQLLDSRLEEARATLLAQLTESRPLELRSAKRQSDRLSVFP
jgi:hypothetical protein